MRKKKDRIKFDALRMYFGEPYEIDLDSAVGKITVFQPSIGDIVRIGENRFNPAVHMFVANTTLYRAFLWENGLDWNEISDFQLFCLLYKTVDAESSALLFGDLDWHSFEPYFIRPDTDDGQVKMVLASRAQNIEINEDVYEHFHQYIQGMFRMFPEDELTDDATLKKWWIDKDKREAKRREKKKKDDGYSMLSQISAYINHPGTKYKLSELKEVGVCEFYDSLERLRIYEHSTAILKGMMGGFVDGSKIKAEEYDFMRDIHK